MKISYSRRFANRFISVFLVFLILIQIFSSTGILPNSIQQTYADELPMPSIPSNINYLPTETSISLAWDAVPGATGYDVEADGIVLDNGVNNTYIHTGLLPGSEHTYRVRAKNANGVSEWSVSQSESTLLGVPNNIFSTSTFTSIALTWNAMPGATGYDIEVDGTIIDNGINNTYIHDGLEPDTLHWYRVRTKNSGGTSDWSQFVVDAVAAPLIAGGSHNLALMQDGTVKVWGDNQYGQLGMGNNDINVYKIPTLVPNLSNVKQVAAGFNHSVALMKDGTVKAWGINDRGQLGLGDYTDRNAPETIPGLSGVKQIIAGYYATIAVLGDGSVKAWGFNGSGALGIGNNINQNSPVTVSALTNIKKIVAGNDTAMALLRDGSVQVWGANQYGQLGLGNTTYRNTPTINSYLGEVSDIFTGGASAIVLMKDGSVKAWGINFNGRLGFGDEVNRNIPTVIPGLTGVKQVDIEDRSIFLMEDGTLKVCGRNSLGQLGLGDGLDRNVPTTILGIANVNYVSTGYVHTVATFNDMSTKVWGSNNIYQLGLGDTANRAAPTSLTGLRGFEVPSKVTVINSTATENTITLNWNSSTGATGYDVEVDGVVIDSGSSNTYTHNNLLIGSQHTYRIRAKNANGASEWSPPQVKTSLPAQGNGTGLRAEYYSGMEFNTFVVSRVDSNIDFNWGTASPDILVPSDLFSAKWTGYVQPKYTGTYTFYTSADNGVRLWVNGQQLVNRWTNTVGDNSGTIDLVGGQKYSIRLDYLEGSGGASVKLQWSSQSQAKEVIPQSQLYLPILPPTNITSTALNTEVILSWDAVDDAIRYDIKVDGMVIENVTSPYTHGGILPNTLHSYRVKVKTLEGESEWSNVEYAITLPSLTAGYAHALALMPDETIQAWGDNTYGQLGLGNTITITTPTTIPNLSNVKQIAAGHEFNLVLLKDGTVMAFGRNESGQLGLGDNNDRNVPTLIPGLTSVKQIAVGYKHGVALLNDGTVKAWGYNADGALGLGDTTARNAPTIVPSISNVKYITAGAYHTIALLNNGSCMAWGHNNYGSLGMGDTTFRYVPTTIPNLTDVRQIVAGGHYNFAIMNDSTVKAWGINFNGRLGLGDTTQRNSPTTIPNLANVKQIIGNECTLAVMNDGTVKVCGRNHVGQLGLGDTTDRLVLTELQGIANAIQVVTGGTFSLVLLADGTVKTTGANGLGQLGLGDYVQRSSMVEIPNLNLINISNIPRNINAVTTASTITLSWDPVAGATAYEVEADGTIIDNGTNTTYTHNNLLIGSRHTYRIRAKIANGVSGWSTSQVKTSLPVQGNGTGLKAEYYSGMEFNTFVLSRVDSNINFNWGTESPDFLVPTDLFSAKWTGYVQPKYTGTYTFYTSADNGVRLWVNGQQLVNRWTNTVGDNSGTIDLVGGQKYSIRLDYLEGSGGASVKLQWSSQSQAKEVIPQSQLYLPLSAPANITATAASTSVTVAWDAVEGATGYDIEVDGSVIGNGTSTTYVHSGLQPNTQHTYRVRAKSLDTVGFWSNPVVQTTLARKITADGNTEDWIGISPIATGTGSPKELYAVRDNEKLYVLVKGEGLNLDNALFIDSDKNGATGCKNAKWTSFGAEYMIGGGKLFKYLGTGTDWSWGQLGRVSFYKSNTTIELVIELNRLEINGSGEVIIRFDAYAAGSLPIAWEIPASVNITIPGNDQTVVEPPKAPIQAKITVDGDTSDWEGISPISTGSGAAKKLYAVRDGSKLYILVKGEGLGPDTSFFIDSDKNGSTGHRNNSWINFGAEYNIANRLYKYIGVGYNWNWAALGYVERYKSDTTIEVAIELNRIGITETGKIIIAFDGLNGRILPAADLYPATTDIVITGNDQTIEDPPKEPIQAKITVDGDTSDWAGISPISSGTGTIKELYAVRDSRMLYILLKGEALGPDNEFFIDSDKNGSTGYRNNAWINLGADYVIGGGKVGKYTGAGYNWGWGTLGRVLYYKSDTTIELAIELNRIEINSPGEITIAYNGYQGRLLPTEGLYPAKSNIIITGNDQTLEEPPKAPIQAKITVDGNTSDWSGISPITTGTGTIKDLYVVRDSSMLYVLLKGEGLGQDNEFFIDSDKNGSTGYRNNAWINLGAEYILGGGNVAQYTGVGYNWGWKNMGSIAYYKSDTTIEFAIELERLGISESDKIIIAYNGYSGRLLPAEGMYPATSDIVITGTELILEVPNPAIAEIGSDKLTLSWDAVAGATGYDIEVDGSVIDNGTSTTYVHSGLQPNTQHSYRVRAKAGSTIGQWSELITQTTKEAVPKITSGLSFEKVPGTVGLYAVISRNELPLEMQGFTKISIVKSSEAFNSIENGLPSSAISSSPDTFVEPKYYFTVPKPGVWHAIIVLYNNDNIPLGYLETSFDIPIVADAWFGEAGTQVPQISSGITMESATNMLGINTRIIKSALPEWAQNYSKIKVITSEQPFNVVQNGLPSPIYSLTQYAEPYYSNWLGKVGNWYTLVVLFDSQNNPIGYIEESVYVKGLMLTNKITSGVRVENSTALLGFSISIPREELPENVRNYAKILTLSSEYPLNYTQNGMPLYFADYAYNYYDPYVSIPVSKKGNLNVLVILFDEQKNLLGYFESTVNVTGGIQAPQITSGISIEDTTNFVGYTIKITRDSLPEWSQGFSKISIQTSDRTFNVPENGIYINKYYIEQYNNSAINRWVSNIGDYYVLITLYDDLNNPIGYLEKCVTATGGSKVPQIATGVRVEDSTNGSSFKTYVKRSELPADMQGFARIRVYTSASPQNVAQNGLPPYLSSWTQSYQEPSNTSYVSPGTWNVLVVLFDNNSNPLGYTETTVKVVKIPQISSGITYERSNTFRGFKTTINRNLLPENIKEFKNICVLTSPSWFNVEGNGLPTSVDKIEQYNQPYYSKSVPGYGSWYVLTILYDNMNNPVGYYQSSIYIYETSYPAVPELPTTVSAQFSNEKVLFAWDTVQGAVTYDIRINGDNNKITNNAINPYIDSAVQPGQAYIYQVRGVNQNGAGEWSNGISVYVPYNTSSGTNVEVSQPEIGAKLVFDNITSAGQTKIEKIDTLPSDGTYFQLKEAVKFYDITSTATFSGSVIVEFSYDPETLTVPEGSLRLFQFKDGKPIDITLNEPGNPDTVNHKIRGVVTDHFCVFAVGVPMLPIGLKEVSKTDTKVNLNWNSIAGASYYEVYSGSRLVKGSLESNSFTVEGLAKGDTYLFSVRAKDETGRTIAYSNDLMVDMIDSTTPTGLKCLSKTETTVELSWNPPLDVQNLTGYEVYLNERKAFETGSQTSYIVKGLMPGTSYTFTVKAKYGVAKISNPSNSITAMTNKDTQVPSVPSGFSASEVHDTSLTITWSPSRDNTYIACYEVYRNNTKVGTAYIPEFTDKGLTKYTAYKYTVKAYDVSGNYSSVSTEFSITTLNDDYGNDLNSATPIYLNVEREGAIETSGDVDFFRFVTPVGGKYLFEIMSNSGTGAELLSSDGVSVSSKIESGSSGFRISADLVANVPYYYIKAKNSASGIGRYSIKISRIGLPSISNGYIEVAAGEKHVVALKGDGTVWTWGSNEWYELGYEGRNSSIPKQVPGLNGIKAVAAGYHHSIALKEDGTVWVWGYDGNGGLLRQVDGISRIIAVSAGYDQSIALKEDGTVWVWGDNKYKQIENSSIIYISPSQVQGLNGIIGIDTEYSHWVALKNDGTVWTWGNNSSGQLGDGTYNKNYIPAMVSNLTGVIAIVAGYEHTAVLKSNGEVWAWGNGCNGQIGNNYALSSNSAPMKVQGISNITEIAAGKNHTLALRNDGTLWAWGNNSYGQLGNGTSISTRIPLKVEKAFQISKIQCGGAFSTALTYDGKIYSWGENFVGQLGNGVNSYIENPIEITNFNGVREISGGNDYTVALKNDGTVWTWGKNFNYYSQSNTALMKPLPELVQGITGVTAVSAGYEHTVALKNDGTVWAWGDNLWGALGDGTSGYKSIPTKALGLSDIRAIAAGNGFTVALKSDGTVWTWGDNRCGQLGRVTTDIYSLFPQQVPGLTDIRAIAAGNEHVIALKNDGTVWAWGKNRDGQLGDGTVIYSNSPVNVVGLTGVTGISAGYDCSVALKSDGTVWEWGHNLYHTEGDGVGNWYHLLPVKIIELSKIIQISLNGNHLGNHLLALESNGTLWAMGENGYGQLGDGTIIDKFQPIQINGIINIEKIVSGYTHSMAIKNDGTLYAWGDNDYGQFGNGDKGYSEVPVEVLGLKKVSISIRAVSKTPIAIASSASASQNGKVYSTGGIDYDSFSTINAAYSYDPSTNQWISAGNLNTPRWGHAMAVIGNKLYVVGGVNNGYCLNSVEVYDTSVQGATWTVGSVPNMKVARAKFGLAAVDVGGNINLYAIGGVNSSGYIDSIEAYDPATNTWTLLSDKLPTPRANFAVAVIDKKIYVIGGHNADGNVISKIDVFDTVIGKWGTLDSTLPTARTGCRAVTLNGKIYVIGGFNSNYLGTIEVFDPVAGTWEIGTGLSTARMDFGVSVANGKIYVIGGKNDFEGGALDSVGELTP